MEAIRNAIKWHLNLRWVIILMTIMLLESCKKLLEISPPTNNIVVTNVYTSDATAIAVLTGIYTDMSKVSTTGGFTGNSSISLLSGLSSDELTLYSGATNAKFVGYYRNELSVNSPVSGSEFWSPLYNFIFRCNAAIEGLTAPGADALNPTVKKQLLGEAKFLRGFFYFYLVNLYGDVPLAVSTDYKVNTLLSRSPVSSVYEQIIADLKDAKGLLSESYLDVSLMNGTIQRVRPTKWAAIALLARAYLYTNSYANAETETTILINNTALFNLPQLNVAFLKNSNEAILQIQPTTLNFNTEDARTFIIPATGPTSGSGTTVNNPVYFSLQLLNSFEIGDQRQANGNWVKNIIVGSTTYYYPFKYKNNTLNSNINATTGTANMVEYLMVLRLGEQYLIRAESRAQLNNISGSQADLNAIRTRAGLGNTLANDKPSLLTAILHERQVELFAEWGHRWLDLKRTGNADAVMGTVTPLKGGTWQTTDKLYPLPLAELQKAPNLIQNQGY